MSTGELLALLGLTGWAVYRQTRTSEVVDKGRFIMAIVYAGVGVAVGGFAVPTGAGAWALLLTSFSLSAVVGAVRGRLTTLWLDAAGRAWRKGNAVTGSLFLGLVAGKVALGTIAYIDHVDDGAGFGETLLMIAIMLAVQVEVLRRRAGRERSNGSFAPRRRTSAEPRVRTGS